MPLDIRHSFPITHEQAVKILRDAPWTDREAAFLSKYSLATTIQPIGGQLRKYWYLDEETSILGRHYRERFSLGDGSDMASMVLENWFCLMRGETFNMTRFAQSLRQEWLVKGIDPLTMRKIPNYGKS
jgi:hypothetical protein